MKQPKQLVSKFEQLMIKREIDDKASLAKKKAEEQEWLCRILILTTYIT